MTIDGKGSERKAKRELEHRFAVDTLYRETPKDSTTSRQVRRRLNQDLVKVEISRYKVETRQTKQLARKERKTERRVAKHLVEGLRNFKM